MNSPLSLLAHRLSLRLAAVSVLALALPGATLLPSSGTLAAPSEYICDNASSYDGSNFLLHMCNMPDLDQRRTEAPPFVTGLPNDGEMYCVPTAAMNVCAYISAHGYPNLHPGVANWRLNPPQHPEYSTMSNHLKTMGQLMGTTPQGGTGGAAAEDGLEEWLNGSQNEGWSSPFVVSRYCASGFYSPRFADAALSALSGSLVVPVVGWYSNPDTSASHERDGGHALTLAHAAGNTAVGANCTIGVRDPAAPNDGKLMSQSPYATEYYPVVDVLGKFDGWPRYQSRIVGYGSAYMDEYFAVRPRFGLTADPGNHIVLHLSVDWFGSELTKTFSTPGDKKLLDIAVSPERTSHPFLLEGDDTIWQIDAITGECSWLADSEGPRRLAFGGPEQSLFVLLPRHLVRLDRDGAEVGRVRLRHPVDAIAFDELRDEVVGYSSKGRRLVVYDAELRPKSQIPVPGPVPGPRGAKVSLAVSGLDGAIWLHRDGSAAALRVRSGDRGAVQLHEVDLEGVEAPEGLFVDERGHLFVTDRGVIAELDADGRRVERSYFAGREGTGAVRLLLPFTNFDPRTMTGPAYENVLPTEFGRSVEE
jgi:hypothetical protein